MFSTFRLSFRLFSSFTRCCAQVLQAESRYDQIYEDNISSLTINNVTLADSGEYVCRATNEEGSGTSSGQLTVKRRRILSCISKKKFC